MVRVFVDTNVLFPFSLMDLMLALTPTIVTTWRPLSPAAPRP